MKKRVYAYVVVCFLISVGIVAGLMTFSNSLRIQHGSFLREFPPHPALEREAIDLGFNSYYIAGVTENSVFLGNYTSPLNVVVVRNFSPLDTQHVKIRLEVDDRLKVWSPRVRVDSPRFYLVDGVVPMIYQGNINNWAAEKVNEPRAYFNDLIPMEHGVVGIKSRSAFAMKDVLGKIDLNTRSVELTDRLLIAQGDGIFSVDGMMHYSKDMRALVYVYYYRNEIVVADSSLNLRNAWHTIDTISKAQITLASIEADTTIVMAAPPVTVNKLSAVSDSRLYVNSARQASNEDDLSFGRGAVIDTYDLQNGEYLFSFYLYDLHGKSKLDEFKVAGGRIYALFENYLQLQEFQPKYIPASNASQYTQ